MTQNANGHSFTLTSRMQKSQVCGLYQLNLQKLNRAV